MSSTILPRPPDEKTADRLAIPRLPMLDDLMIPQRVARTRLDAFEALERTGARVFLEIDGRASIQKIVRATGLGRRRVLQEVSALAYAGLITFLPAF